MFLVAVGRRRPAPPVPAPLPLLQLRSNQGLVRVRPYLLRKEAQFIDGHCPGANFTLYSESCKCYKVRIPSFQGGIGCYSKNWVTVHIRNGPPQLTRRGFFQPIGVKFVSSGPSLLLQRFRAECFVTHYGNPFSFPVLPSYRPLQ